MQNAHFLPALLSELSKQLISFCVADLSYTRTQIIHALYILTHNITVEVHEYKETIRIPIQINDYMYIYNDNNTTVCLVWIQYV